MAYPTIPTYASGDLIKLSDLQAMYDGMQATMYPQQDTSPAIPGDLGTSRGLTLYPITSTSRVAIGSPFSLGIVTDGRRAIVTFPLTMHFVNTGASAATGEMLVFVDGIANTNSIMTFQAPISQNSFWPNLVYTFITGVLSAGYHTFQMRARILTGLSTPTMNFYEDMQNRMIVRAY